jgi:hypothetical protein
MAHRLADHREPLGASVFQTMDASLYADAGTIELLEPGFS